jgi:two-component system, OmpR family, response regulator RpaB
MAAKILLVEDDNNLREIYEARLQAEGYSIVTAQDGEAALVVAKAEKPDLIISDVMMPRISGFEMLDILRNTEELKYIKVIMLTALGQAEDKTRANSLGADRYLVKSQVTLEDIVTAAHSLIDTPSTAPTGPVTSPTAAASPTPTDQSAPATTTTSPEPSVAPATPVVTPASPPVAPEPSPATTPESPQPFAPAPAVPPSTPETPVTPPPSDSAAALPQFKLAPEEVHSEPAPAATTAAPAMSIPSAPDLVTPTTEEEKATVSTQISDFAKNIPVGGDTASKDDTVLSDALSDLTTNTPTQVVTATTAETTPSHDQTIVPSPEPAPTEVNEPSAEETTNFSSNNVTIANKKIIQPIKSDPKPGLDELLAAEAAKTAPVTVSPMPTETPQPTDGVAGSQPGNIFAPNIALATPPDVVKPTGSDPSDISL